METKLRKNWVLNNLSHDLGVRYTFCHIRLSLHLSLVPPITIYTSALNFQLHHKLHAKKEVVPLGLYVPKSLSFWSSMSIDLASRFPCLLTTVDFDLLEFPCVMHLVTLNMLGLLSTKYLTLELLGLPVSKYPVNFNLLRLHLTHHFSNHDIGIT